MEVFRSLPAQAGQFTRMNATPSVLPLMSTGRAMYPVPPQRGQSFGATLPTSIVKEFFINSRSQYHKLNLVTKREQALRSGDGFHLGFRQRFAIRRGFRKGHNH